MVDKALIELYSGILKKKWSLHKQYTFNEVIYILLKDPKSFNIKSLSNIALRRKDWLKRLLEK